MGEIQSNEKKVIRRKKAFVNEKRCVGCGCCVKVCPLKAIQIYKGIRASIDHGICVGCGKCVKECPGTLIEIKEVE